MASDINKEYDIKNPFETRSDLVEIVSNLLKFGQDESLNKIIHNRRDEIAHEDIYAKNNDDFYVFLFNTWKKNLLSISYDDIKKGNVDANFDIMPIINYLNHIPDAKSKKDVDRYLNPVDAEIRHFMNKYCFQNNHSSWHTIDSRDLTIIDNKDSNVGFITLNIKRYDIPKFCKIFTRMCLEKNIQFSYKYNDSDNINDNFILFFDNSNVDEYIKIIREIFRKFPNLASRIGRPSSLMGRTNDNIGFAVGNYEDYYSKRIEHINECTNEIANSFISNNLKKKINSELGNISIVNYFSYEIAKKIIEKKCKKAVESRSYSSFVKYKSPDYLKKVSVIVRKSLAGKNKNLIPENSLIIDIDNESISVDYETIEMAYSNTAKLVYESYPHLYESLLSYIKISSSLIGISSNYFIDCEENKNTGMQLKNVRV